MTQLFTDLAQATGLKMVNLAQPVRVALTGKTASPGLYEIIHILGREEALRRINTPSSLRHRGNCLELMVAAPCAPFDRNCIDSPATIFATL